MEKADSEFGKEVGLVHKMIVTGRKVGANREFYARLADDEEFFREVVSYVLLEAEEKTTIEFRFRIKDGPIIIGVFNDSIFGAYPGKAIEVLEKLVVLVRGKPRGEFRFTAKFGYATLSYNSGPLLSCICDSYNAYGLALHFLEEESTKKYIASLHR